MPDETTNTDVPVAPVVAGVSAEVAASEAVPSVAVEQPVTVEVVEQPIVVAEVPVALEPVPPVFVPAEPVIESATRIDVFTNAPLPENIDSSVVETVTEPSVVAEQPVVAETPVAIEPAPVADAPVESTVVEPITAVEQPASIIQEPAVPQSVDSGLTPQQRVAEALKPEIVQEILPPKLESTPVVTPSSLSQATDAHTQPVARPLGFFVRLAAKAHQATQARKRNKLDRIMGLFAKQASITNDDAEKLLHISDATASRYLGILEKEGKVKQVGRVGRWVSYTKV